MSNKISKFVMTSSLSQSEFFFRPDTIPTQRTCETSHKNISHSKYEKFYKFNSHVYLAYFRSYSLFKISKCIGMYWKINFKNRQNSLENACMTLTFSWQILQGILWISRFGWEGGYFVFWGGGGGSPFYRHTYALQTRLVAICLSKIATNKYILWDFFCVVVLLKDQTLTKY